MTKAKSSKNFLDSASQNLGWILRICTLRVRFCGIVESADLRFCKIASFGEFESLKRERTLLFAKAKSSKSFYFVALRADLFFLWIASGDKSPSQRRKRRGFAFARIYDSPRNDEKFRLCDSITTRVFTPSLLRAFANTPTYHSHLFGLSQ